MSSTKIPAAPWWVPDNPNCLGTWTVFHGMDRSPRTDNQVCQVATRELAQLVTALPDLLTACEAARDFGSQGDTHEGYSVSEIIRAAIAKATGKVAE